MSALTCLESTVPPIRVAASSFVFALVCMLVATAAYGMQTRQVEAAVMYAVGLSFVHLAARAVVGRRADVPAATFVATVAGYLLAVRLGGHDPVSQDGAAVVVGLVVAAGVAAMPVLLRHHEAIVD